MREKCRVEEGEGRGLDSYDLITVLGLIKESDFKGVLRNYSPGGKPGAKINPLSQCPGIPLPQVRHRGRRTTPAFPSDKY
jgi:hypothetical protein